MATQRYISTSFWDDKWIRSLNPSDRYLYMYLLTNTLTNICGIYQITIDRIAYDTGYDERTLRPMLDKFKEAKKAALIDDEWIILPSWPKHQKWDIKATIKAGIDSALANVPKHILNEARLLKYTYPIDSLLVGYQCGPSYSDSDLDTDIDLDTDTDTDRDASPSASHPLTFESFAKQCAETWNDLGIKPAFRFTTSAGLTGKEREGFLTSSARYSMDEIIQAMRNYHDIGASAAHEVFPKGYGLSGFLAGGVEKFTDDADPWTRCRKKATGEQTTEERNAMISKIAAEISKPDPKHEPEKFSDDEYFADDPHPEPLVFDAKKAMTDIRKMAGRNEARRA